MSLSGLDLFNLLPAVYRVRDGQLAQQQVLLSTAEQAQLTALQAQTTPLTANQQTQLNELLAKAARGPLQSLLMLIQEQLAVVSEDMDQLYDDQFIETCAEWVIPYIGDLIGYRSVKGIASAIDNPRAEVANTISFRRRKGTVLVLEQLARDATGWGAHAVEFFRILADTQYMKHLRPDNHYAPDLRRWQPGLYRDRGFDHTAHKVDVRRIASGRGRYNIQNIGIFLWSLTAYSVTKTPVTALKTAAGQAICFRFSTLGVDMPLFHRAVPQGADITAAAQPFNVADRLRRRALCDDIQKGVGVNYYGENNSLVLYLNNQALDPYQIQVCNLSGPDGSWANLPNNNLYAAVVDPELGRIALPPNRSGTLSLSYRYGFNADIGGGEYIQPSSFIVTNTAWVIAFPDPRWPNLPAAVAFAITQLAIHSQVAVELTGTQVLSLSGTPGTPALSINLPSGSTLELRSAEGFRSTLLLDAEIAVSGGSNSRFALNGLLIAANPAMTAASPLPPGLLHIPKILNGNANQLGRLDLNHCTLVPGWSVNPASTAISATRPAVYAEAVGLQLSIVRTITGSILADEFVTTVMCDSIVDAANPVQPVTPVKPAIPTYPAYAATDGNNGGGALTCVGCTLIGKIHTILLTLASNCIFQAELSAGDTWQTALIADRKQAGCVRFSYLPLAAQTPRRFECVQQGADMPQPLFFSLQYGHPAYAKLLTATDDRIHRGADDAGEMGAFHFLLAPLRENDLRVRILEYLPVGMEFGIIYQN